jgi:hypothetical protein
VQFHVTGSDGGRWPRALWRTEATEIVDRAVAVRQRVNRRVARFPLRLTDLARLRFESDWVWILRPRVSVQHGTHMYHPHADELVQLATGMMGMFVIHPRAGERIDRDYCFLLHNWALHPGTYRPDPAIMQEFDLWTFNSKVFPAIEPLLAQTGERVRVRIGNLSMWNHPIHMHGVQFHVTGSDGGRWPRALWRTEATEIVGVGQTRDLEFIAVPGDWALHCHMAHHTMNAMGHEMPNPLGVKQRDLDPAIRRMLPGYMAMGEAGMAEHQEHTDSGHMRGPENTLPMFGGQGPFGNLEMGGMFTVIKVRDRLPPDGGDPGWYSHPPGSVARLVSDDHGN